MNEPTKLYTYEEYIPYISNNTMLPLINNNINEGFID